MQSDENFLCENSLPVLTSTANIWRVLQVDENIVTRIFNIKILWTKLTQITVILIDTCAIMNNHNPLLNAIFITMLQVFASFGWSQIFCREWYCTHVHRQGPGQKSPLLHDQIYHSDYDLFFLSLSLSLSLSLCRCLFKTLWVAAASGLT